MPAPLPERYSEILEAYVLHVQDAAPWNELTQTNHLSVIRSYLRWLAEQTLTADPFDDPDGRDTAVGFYKRTMFSWGAKPVSINAVLLALNRFYTWWGLGAHTVPSMIVVWRDTPPDDENPTVE